jgi:hypothetical protein
MRGRTAWIASFALLACTRASEPSPSPINAGEEPTATPEPGEAKTIAPDPAAPDSAAPDSAPATSEPPPKAAVDELYVALEKGGLVRLAGSETKAQPIEAFARQRVIALASDANDLVYAADITTLRVIRDGAVVHEHAGSDMAVGYARALHATSERAIWVLGSTGLAHFDGDRWQPVPLPALEYPRDVTVDASGRVWVMGLKTLLRREGESFVPVTGLPDDVRSLHGFLDVPGHALTIEHSSGIDCFDDERWISESLSFVLGGHVDTGRVLGMVSADMEGGTIAAASYRQVTARSDPYRRFFEPIDQVHPVTKIDAVEVDGRGRTWVATDGGLMVLEKPEDDFRWIGPGAIPGIEDAPSHVLALGNGPVLPTLVDPGRGVVRGKLRFRGKPLARATLHICTFPSLEGSKGFPCDFTEIVNGATTAADGTFELTNVLPGRYRMAVHVGSGQWRYLSVDDCCLATRPGAPQDLGTIDAKDGDKEGW